jgi:hypothetical protein
LPKALGRELAVAGAGAGLTSRALGSNTGAETHTQSGSELASHSHLTNERYYTPDLTGATAPTGSPVWGADQGMSYAGSSAAASILSPRTHVNIMVCL